MPAIGTPAATGREDQINVVLNVLGGPSYRIALDTVSSEVSFVKICIFAFKLASMSK